MIMSLSRIWTVVTRYFYAHRGTPSSFFDFFYWPVVDILLFGFVSVWLTQQNDFVAFNSLMTGIVLWQIVHRVNLEIGRSLAQELWDENLVNFFSTPLSVNEWMLGMMISGFLCIFITIPYGALLVYLLFGYNIFSIGIVLIPLILLLVISGWIMGFFAASFLIYWGEKIDSVIWAIACNLLLN